MSHDKGSLRKMRTISARIKTKHIPAKTLFWQQSNVRNKGKHQDVLNNGTHVVRQCNTITDTGNSTPAKMATCSRNNANLSGQQWKLTAANTTERNQNFGQKRTETEPRPFARYSIRILALLLWGRCGTHIDREGGRKGALRGGRARQRDATRSAAQGTVSPGRTFDP